MGSQNLLYLSDMSFRRIFLAIALLSAIAIPLSVQALRWGDPCTRDAECNATDNLFCDTTCKDKSDDGEGCNGNDGSCLPGLTCRADDSGDLFCRRGGVENDACTNSRDCTGTAGLICDSDLRICVPSLGPGVACQRDDQCGAVLQSCVQNTCAASGGPCRGDSDCGRVLRGCVNNRCAACGQDAECLGGAVCRQGQCIQRDCQADADCGNGQRCLNRVCVAGGNGGGRDDGIFLLEPIGGVTSIPVTQQNLTGFGVFFYYFNLLWPWVVGMGAGIAVLMGVIGGIQIIQAGSDQGKVSAGKNRLLLSLGGLLIILLSGTLLNALNPTFYQFYQ